MEPKKTSPWVWVGVGCGVLVVGFVGFLVFLFTVIFGAMRSSTPYKEALQRAQTDPRVAAAFGTPIKAGTLVSGSINTHNNDGDAKLDIPISGPKGSGTLHVTATKTDGKWFYNRMYVERKGEPEIDLMASP
jgi:hypothetical protein